MSSSKNTKRKVMILDDLFDPWESQKNYQQESLPDHANFGATASFIGTMRDFNEGDDVSSMVLEHYPDMTRKQLNRIIDTAENRWPLLNTLIIHRVGSIFPGEPIMLVAVWSKHRAAAFDACRYLMEELKHHAPFWKKEMLSTGGSRWVEKNTDGYE